MSLEPGIYTIYNAYVDIVLDLPVSEGSANNGAPVMAWQQHTYTTPECTNQLWLLERTQAAKTYTVRNLKGGTYLDLAEGSRANGTRIIGWQRTSYNQEWVIDKPQGSFNYKLRNSMSETFLELRNGGGGNGNEIVGWSGAWVDNGPGDHQMWSFERVSYTGGDIKTMIQSNPYMHGFLKCYDVDRIYWILDPHLLKYIWNTSQLGNGRQYPYRTEIFDCDDFAVAYKDTVAKWGSDNLRADGFALLCGLMICRSRVVDQLSHAYNFTLADVNYKLDVLFIEPQNGTSTTDIGYDGILAFF